MKNGVIKNLLFVFGFVIIIFCALPAKVKATEAEDYSYREDDGKITITGLNFYNGSVEKDMIIPNEIAGKPVTVIGDYAFIGCGYMGKLVIPESVTTIGYHAFSGCSGFTGDLIIPDSVTTIEGGAFSDCSGFSGNLKIGNSVTTIGYDAFLGCDGLTGDLIIPDSVTEIQDWAFSGCKGFSSIKVPFTYDYGTLFSVFGNEFDRIKNIIFLGEHTISFDKNSIEASGKMDNIATLDNVIFLPECEFTAPKTKKFVGWSYSPEGEIITEDQITLTEDTTLYALWEDIIPISLVYEEIDDQIIITGYEGDSLGELVIPDKINGKSVTTIGDYAFSGCRGFTGNLTIPESVTKIGEFAFYGCSGFEGDLIIPNSVTTIGTCAFDGCRGFNGKLRLSESLTTIGEAAFVGCTGFTGDLTIPPKVTTIGDSAFNRCYGFTGNLKISENVTVIGNAVFSGCSGFTGDLTIPENVTTIGEWAFSGCSGFTGNLTIPGSVTTIGDSAFGNCGGFTGDLTIPENVTTIGNNAFFGCIGFSLISVPFPRSDYYENSVFSYFKNVKYKGESETIFVYVIKDDEVTITGYKYVDINSFVIPNLIEGKPVTTIGEWAFSDCKGFTGNLIIPESVTTIGDFAFKDCKGFTGDLTIHGSVTTIGVSAFENCNGFTGDLTISENVTTIGKWAFSGCSGFTGNLTIPGSVTTIGDCAFENCNGFTGNLIINNGVTGIGSCAFMDCSGFTGDLTIPDSVKGIGMGAFSGCSGFTGDLTISKGITVIHEDAFKNCSGFTGDLTIPYGVKYIMPKAFAWCKGFTGDLIIPDSVTEITESAFECCTGFKGGLKIGKSVISIGRYAFEGCSGLTGELIIPESVTTISDLAFNDCSGLSGDLIIPKSVTTIGKFAFLNTKFLSISVPFKENEISSDIFNGYNGIIKYKGDYFVYFEKNNDGAEGEMSRVLVKNQIYTLPDNEFTAPEGMIFDGWSFSEAGDKISEPQITLTKDTKLFAIWENAKCLISFEGGNEVNGIAPDSIEANKGSTVKLPKNSFTKEGYKFVGWTNGTNTYAEEFEFTVPQENSLTLTAKWEAIEYRVSFEGGEGTTGSAPSEMKGYINDTVTLPKNTFTKKGYKFAGWSDGSNTYDEETTYTIPAKDVKFTAQWEALPVYKVTFAGGSGATGIAPTALSGNENDTVTLPKNTFTKKGYKFAGWSDGSKTFKAGATYIIPAKDVKFTVKWEALPVYKVTFAGGSGATGIAPTALSGNENDTVTLPKNTFTKKGYKFVGWSDGTKTYKEGATYTIPSKDVKFTVKWEKLPVYKITFAGGSGSTGKAPSSLSGNEKDKVKLPKNTFAKNGYTFIGWSDGSKTYKAGATYTIPAKDVKLTAKWQKNVPTKRELIEQFAERMYTQALGRGADPEGLKYWADRMEKQIDDGANMAYGFIVSTEFQARKLSDEQFIETMYQTFFGRSYDATGKTYWLNQIKGGVSREKVLAGFVKSEEFSKLCADAGIERGLIMEDGKPVNAGIYQFVKRQYTCCLQRDGERDGMDYWASKIAKHEVSAVDMAKEFFFSTEFESKGLSDKQYVERLYETFLGRSFDEGGYAYWNDKMSRGETRREVIDEFAASEEFKGILNGYGL